MPGCLGSFCPGCLELPSHRCWEVALLEGLRPPARPWSVSNAACVGRPASTCYGVSRLKQSVPASIMHGQYMTF